MKIFDTYDELKKYKTSNKIINIVFIILILLLLVFINLKVKVKDNTKINSKEREIAIIDLINIF